MKLAVAISMLLAIVLALFMKKGSPNMTETLSSPGAQWGQTQARSHKTDEGFQNRYGVQKTHQGQWPYIRMRLFEERFPKPAFGAITPMKTYRAQDLPRVQEGIKATWLGHASVLVQMNGKNYLTDPVFSMRASFSSWFGPKRYSKPAIQLTDLPDIDYVLISHNHYDHLDSTTVAALGNTVHWIVPLGLKAWFAKRNIHRVTELDWFEAQTIDGIAFKAWPSQHWSGRSLRDTNKTLWASFSVDDAQHSFWFAGDTGYHPALFAEIAEQMPAPDLALIPIGGYGPERFMAPKHITPEDAVAIHHTLNAKQSIGIHWGTFVLTSEPIDEPPKRLKEAMRANQRADASFVALPLGGQWTL